MADQELTTVPPTAVDPEAAPDATQGSDEWQEELTPREIVQELDKYIVGQDDAKKAVAISLRNRWRRQRVDSELRDEIFPNNLILIGPTGVGKTEISRRLAKLAGAPFVKVEASKFTEVGYVGRDVESMVRDLVDTSVTALATNLRGDVHRVVEVGVVRQQVHLEPLNRMIVGCVEGELRAQRLELDAVLLDVLVASVTRCRIRD